jgi:hypothetical protein
LPQVRLDIETSAVCIAVLLVRADEAKLDEAQVKQIGQMQTPGEKYMAKAAGIGGVFFKRAGKGSELAAWYEKNLGLSLESWGGATLKWPDD